MVCGRGGALLLMLPAAAKGGGLPARRQRERGEGAGVEERGEEEGGRELIKRHRGNEGSEATGDLTETMRS